MVQTRRLCLFHFHDMKREVKKIVAVRDGVTSRFSPTTWGTMDGGENGKYGWEIVHEREMPDAVKANIEKVERPKVPKVGKPPIDDVNED